MKIDGDTITFSSGRTAYVNCGIVGIADDLKLFGGYDGGIDWPPGDWIAKEQRITDSDMLELADYMIALWGRFKGTIGRT